MTASPSQWRQELDAIVGDFDQYSTDCFMTHDWGIDELGRKNHERVALINAALAAKGFRTWLDSNSMTGNILDQVTVGIDSSRVVVIFITKSYVDKVESNSFNVCQLEFNHAVRKRQSAIIVVIMEPRMRMVSRTSGCVGLAVNGLPCVDFSLDDNWAQKCEELSELIRSVGQSSVDYFASSNGIAGQMDNMMANSYSNNYRSMPMQQSQQPSPYVMDRNMRPQSANMARIPYARPSTAPSTQRPYSSQNPNKLLQQPHPQQQQQQYYNSSNMMNSNTSTVLEDETSVSKYATPSPGLSQTISTQSPMRNTANGIAATAVDFADRAPRELATLSVEDVCKVLDHLKLSQFISAFREKQIDGETLSFVQTVAEVSEFGVNIPAKARLFHNKLMSFQSSGVPFDHLQSSSTSDLSSSIRSTSPSGKNTPSSSSTFKVEERVQADFKGNGKWFDATIRRVRQDGTYDVLYDDGDVESGVVAHLIRRRPAFTLGTKVEANYKDKGKWYPGKIDRINHDNTFNVSFDDGETEFNVPSERIRRINESAEKNVLVEGTIVEANYKGKGKWYPGRISRVRGNGGYDIAYDDGEKEVNISEEWIRFVRAAPSSSSQQSTVSSESLQEGTRVEAKHQRGHMWFPARITKERPDGTFDLAYDDGDRETRVSREMIRLPQRSGDDGYRSNPARSPRLEAGSKVEGNYIGRGKWYKGKISREWPDGTFDIDYDDGEIERRVNKEFVRLVDDLPNSSDRRVNKSTDPSRAPRPVLGSKVEANYRGRGKWYAGKITRERLDGTFDVAYDDGESELRVSAEFLRLLDSPSTNIAQLKEGSKVEANYRGRGKWYKGKISRERADGSYDIEYDDGESEMRIEKDMIRLLDNANNRSDSNRLIEGSKVEANYRGRGKWYKGKISRERADGTFDIAYDDGESEMRVEKDMIRLLESVSSSNLINPRPRLEEGSMVEANYRGRGKWFKGKISRERADGTFDIAYDDGESETRVAEDMIRLLESVSSSNPSNPRPRLEEGSMVEANYRGRGKWFKGKISRERADGTFDIAYDDGESETRVAEDMIRLLDLGSGISNSNSNSNSRPIRLEEGSKVEADYRGKGRFYPGKITRDRGDGTYDIAYDDGESETRVKNDMIRLLDNGNNKIQGARPAGLEEGSKVEANYRGKGRFYQGKITRDRGDGTYDIAYDDGESEIRVEKDMIRLLDSGNTNKNNNSRLEEGSKVEANYRGRGKWYSGKISRERADGTFDIAYDDGESEMRVEKEMIRLLGSSSTTTSSNTVSFKFGSVVECNYRGKGKWYTGKVIKVNDNSVDIRFDDGDSEQNVTLDLVRWKEQAVIEYDDNGEPIATDYEKRDRVEANYRQEGVWLRGRIDRVVGDGTFDIIYDNGDVERRVAPRNLKHYIKMASQSLRRVQYYVGDYVGINKEQHRGIAIGRGESNSNGNTKAAAASSIKMTSNYWQQGIIVLDRGNDTYDVKLDEDDSIQSRVSSNHLKLITRAESKSKPQSSKSATDDDEEEDDSLLPKFEFGMIVEGNKYGKGVWVKAVIQRVLSAKKYILAYVDGVIEENVSEGNIRYVDTPASPVKQNSGAFNAVPPSQQPTSPVLTTPKSPGAKVTINPNNIANIKPFSSSPQQSPSRDQPSAAAAAAAAPGSASVAAPAAAPSTTGPPPSQAAARKDPPNPSSSTISTASSNESNSAETVVKPTPIAPSSSAPTTVTQPKTEAQKLSAVEQANMQAMRSITPTINATVAPAAAGMMIVHITKIEIFSLIGYDEECGYDAYTLITFSEKQMARTKTIFETKTSAIWSYNPDDSNMRFDLDIDFIRTGKGSIELKVMNQNNLRPDELIGCASSSLPVELANDVTESGPDVELSCYVLDSYGTRIGCMAITLHRHIYTAEQKLQKDLKPDRKQTKRPSLQINAKSERGLIAALVSEPPPEAKPMLPTIAQEYVAGDKVNCQKANVIPIQTQAGEVLAANADGTYMVKLTDGRVYNRVVATRLSKIQELDFNTGDKVILKKAHGSMGKDNMAGEVFAKNKDGTYMIKLSDGRVYNRVTIDRLSKDSSRPSSRRPSELGQVTTAFLSEDAVAMLNKKADQEAAAGTNNVKGTTAAGATGSDYKIGDRILALRDEKQPDIWTDARIVGVNPDGSQVDVRFLKDGLELKGVLPSRVKRPVAK